MQKLDNTKIIGHSKILEYFGRLVELDGAVQSYIFSGPEGVGKTRLLSEFLTKLMNEEIDESILDSQRQHLDIHLVDLAEGKRDISIEQIRGLIEALSMSPITSTYRIGVVRNAQRLSSSASHALLKLLEEPSARAKVFLLTTDTSQLLPTIQSRCVTVRFSPVPERELAKAAEESGLDSHEANKMARWSFGCPGKLIRYLRNPADFDIILQSHLRALDLVDAPLWRRLAGLNADGAPFDELARSLQVVFRDILYLQSNLPEKVIMHEQTDQLRYLSQKTTAQRVTSALNELSGYSEARASNISPQLFLENILLNV